MFFMGETESGIEGPCFADVLGGKLDEDFAGHAGWELTGYQGREVNAK